jgi:hypothetical protein
MDDSSEDILELKSKKTRLGMDSKQTKLELKSKKTSLGELYPLSRTQKILVAPIFGQL